MEEIHTGNHWFRLFRNRKTGIDISNGGEINVMI